MCGESIPASPSPYLLCALWLIHPLRSDVVPEEGVDAAFAFVEAGPAAGALAFAVGDGACAGLATNRTVASRGEGVHGKVVLADVGLDLIAGP